MPTNIDAILEGKGAPMTTHALCTATSAIRDLYVGGASLDDIRNQHTAFCLRYPKLVDKLMEPYLNQDQLKYIIQMFARVETQHSTLDTASKKIGQDMFDKYVAPDLSPSQLAHMKEQMVKLEKASPEELAQAAAKLAQQQVNQNPAKAPTKNPSTNRRKKKLRKPPA